MVGEAVLEKEFLPKFLTNCMQLQRKFLSGAPKGWGDLEGENVPSAVLQVWDLGSSSTHCPASAATGEGILHQFMVFTRWWVSLAPAS